MRRTSSGPIAAALAAVGRTGGRASYASAVRATSIDYALLEPASVEGRVAVVPMSVGWSDLGSWAALKILRQATADGNVLDAPAGSVIDVGSERVLVHAEGGRLVALVGVSRRRRRGHARRPARLHAGRGAGRQDGRRPAARRGPDRPPLIAAARRCREPFSAAAAR